MLRGFFKDDRKIHTMQIKITRIDITACGLNHILHTDFSLFTLGIGYTVFKTELTYKYSFQSYKREEVPWENPLLYFNYHFSYCCI